MTTAAPPGHTPTTRTYWSTRKPCTAPRRSNQVFVNRRIQPAGCTVGEIRADRIPREALTATAGPDPLHLALVFGICHNTAARDATAAEHLLSDELEHPPAQ